MSEKDLLKNQRMREENIDKVYVLNKVKALITLPHTDYISGEMVANYYEVTPAYVRTIMQRHRSELLSDGVRIVSADNFLKYQDDTLHVEVSKHGKLITFEDGTELLYPHRGLTVFPKRAILRVGMLLRDSDVAAAVRTALLDIEEEKAVVVPETNNDLMQIINMQSERIDKQSEQIDRLISLVEKLTATSLPLQSEEEVKKPTAYIRRKKGMDSWYDEINELVKNVCDVTYSNYNEVLSKAYNILNRQYGLCLEQYRKEYQKQKGSKASMIDTIHWVETERNTKTAGLLAGVLSTMCNERKAS